MTGLRERFTELCIASMTAHGGRPAPASGGILPAVFGSSAARDDDAERAVRAAFAVLDETRRLRWPDGRPAQASAAVEAGDVVLRARPQDLPEEDWTRSGVAGTAVRLLEEAPPGAVWSAAGAYRLTRDAVRYQSARRFPETAGDDDALEAWRATGLSVAAGERRITMLPATRFVGRRRELQELRATVDAAFGERLSRVAVVVGEPGAGKSRLLNELGARVASDACAGGALRWLRGKCRPWLAFSALRDVIEAAAGIDDTDGLEARQEKLAETVAGLPDAAWVRARLRPLAGLRSCPAAREESFAAWRAYLAGSAGGSRLVVVLEDLDQADDALLDFIEALVRDPLHCPVVVLASTHAGLLARRPAFAGDDVLRVPLAPLSPDETRELVAGLIGDESTDVLDTALGRTVATPFATESSVRLLADTGVLLRGTAGVTLVDDVVPPTAVADDVIRARIDELPHAQRALLRDIAVVRDDPWPEALGALSPRGEAELTRVLGELVGRRLLRGGGASCPSTDGRPAFWNGLIADLVLGETPTSERALLHRAAASWREQELAAGFRSGVEELAHHWMEVQSLAEAAGDHELARASLEPTARALEAAGRLALSVDPQTAVHRFRAGLALAGEQDAARVALLQGLGDALAATGEPGRAIQVLRRAVVEAAAGGHRLLAALAGARLAGLLAARGDAGHEQVMRKAADLVRDDAASPEKVAVLTAWAAYQSDVLTERQAAADAADAAIAAAERSGTAAPAALAIAGHARCLMGDPRGVALVQRAAEAAAASGCAEWLAVERRYAACLHAMSGPIAALRRGGQVLARAVTRGAGTATLPLRADRIAYLASLGEWDAALDQATRLVKELDDGGARLSATQVQARQAVLLARRGQMEAAGVLAERLAGDGAVAEPQPVRSVRLLAAAIAHGLAGQTDVADDLVTTWVRGWDGNDAGHASLLPDAIRLAVGCRDPRWLGEPLGAVLRDLPLYGLVIDSVAALRAEQAGRTTAALEAYGDVADRWNAFGAPYEEAQAALGRARCLSVSGRAREAAPWLERAGGLFGALGAKVALREVRGLAAAGIGAVRPPRGTAG